ncbi:MFS transporter [Nonomuraea jiangxiensis]|uniref:Predicted arabinose efflux permease, MFS family n=1 Tax=Nonomuraea jiangxiensis TaxID=633440 RepID=A0A1G8BLX7_9ACTN|nr:MFS transporter [Nonomuraea jiangxiensis]SDH34225.1 Predicted arabinose efflux permease, MFS family [Nonomuraea jiangxiensis]
MSRFGLLREHDFRGLFLADTASQAGTQILVLALPLVAVATLRVSEFEVGLLAACQTVAFVVIGLPAGALVDRLRKRVVMIVSDWARVLALLSVPLAWWLEVLSVYQLYAVALVLGVCTVFFDVAYQSYLPYLVARERLVEGNSALEVVRTVAQLGGPSAGGYLIQFLTAPYALLVTVAGFAWSAACLTTIRKPETRQEVRRVRLGREIAEGLRFVLGHPLLRRIAGCTATSNLFWSMAQPMLLLLLARELGLAAGTIGLLMAAGGLGGLVGALANTRLVRWLGQGPTMWLAIGVPAPMMFALPWLEADWRLGLLMMALFCTGAGVVVYNVTQLSFRQSVTPEELLGRMTATVRFFVWGTVPLGGLLGGVLGEVIGVRETLLVAACGSCLALPWLLTGPIRAMRDHPADGAAPAALREGGR